MAVRQLAAASATSRANLSRWWPLVFALVWLLGFSAWFTSFGMPNNRALQRWMIWSSTPYELLDIVDPPTLPDQAPWSWFFLIQRVPSALIAVFVWCGAWGIGAGVLRMIRCPLRGCERVFFSICVGLSAVSLLMLALGLCGSMSRVILIVALLGAIVLELLNRRRATRDEVSLAPAVECAKAWPRLSRIGLVVLVAMGPFFIGQWLGAMSPQNDFDVVEYHLGGPKEWFLRGQIIRLPHNVYTSFPFLSEMLILTGMVLYGDWQWGALAGQATIAGFAPLTALGLVAAGRRWFSDSAGWLAALVYLTSPWTYRITIIAYAEGALSCYLFAALFATLLFGQYFTDPRARASGGSSGLACLAGLLAGSAMACKYTGLISVVIPIGIVLAWIVVRTAPANRFRSVMTVGFLYLAGVLICIGPWLLKNTVETGNPVYPLAVRVFGGIDRTPDLDAKWRQAHAAKTYPTWGERWKDLPTKITDVLANNDWHSALMFGLAILSLLWSVSPNLSATSSQTSMTQQRVLRVAWLYVGWQFATWWLLTHHIDRFYVPMFSVVALLAGAGGRWIDPVPFAAGPRSCRTIWNGVSAIVIVTWMSYNASVMHLVGGFNAGRVDLKSASDIATPPRIRWLNDEFESGRLPANTKVLCVGEVQLFPARYPYLYNTVFDHSLLEQLCADPNSPDHRLLPADEIRANLRRQGITLIDLNWEWILRYREPGNYGYTDFVHPDLFAELQRLGILSPPLKLPAQLSRLPLGNDLEKQLRQWAPSLMTKVGEEPAYISAQVYPVQTGDAR